MSKCPQCNKVFNDDTKFCDACGSLVVEEAAAPVSETVQETPAPEKKDAPKKTGLILGVAIAAAVIVLLILLFSGIGSLFSGKGGVDGALYLKDNEIVFSDYSKKGTFELTSDLYADEDAEGSYYVYQTVFSKDGKKVFYPDKITATEDGYAASYSLYCRNVNKPKKEAVKVDSNVESYTINEKGTKVIYTKGDDSDLYISDLKDKEKIDSDVRNFYVSDDFKTVIYVTYEDGESNVYIWNGKDKEKIAGEISDLCKVDDDFKTIYYTKEDSLYMHKISGDKEKIASDVCNVVKIYDSGEVYYTEEVVDSFKASDYVDDDMKAADAELKEPEYPEYPDWDPPERPDYVWRSDYDSDEEYDKAYEQYEKDCEAYEEVYDLYEDEYEKLEEEYYDLVDEYYDASEAYNEKESRDDLRESLKEESIERTTYTLCYFDGKAKKTVLEGLSSSYCYDYADEKAVALFDVYASSDVEKVKLSEIDYAYEVSDMVQEAMYEATEKYIVIADKATVIKAEAPSYATMLDDGSAVYFLDNVNEEGEGDLYKVAISKNKAADPKKIDSDVSDCRYFTTENNKLVYFKDVNEEETSGEMYIDGDKIASDVYPYRCSYIDDTIYYYTDWDAEDGCGTLNQYNGKEKKISDDVYDFGFDGNGNLLYLYDCSSKSGKGTLFRYNGKKAKQVDEDVTDILYVITCAD